MIKKLEQAVKTLYKDGIVLDYPQEAKIELSSHRYDKVYCSNACGTFNEHGSFLCCGPYAVLIKCKEAYDTFFEIRKKDKKYRKIIHNSDLIFNDTIKIWDDYLNGKYNKTVKEGELDKNWKTKTVIINNCKDPVYMIFDTMLSKKYLDHALKFLKPKVHWIIPNGKLSIVILTDGSNIAFVCPIRHNVAL